MRHDLSIAKKDLKKNWQSSYFLQIKKKHADLAIYIIGDLEVGCKQNQFLRFLH